MRAFLAVEVPSEPPGRTPAHLTLVFLAHLATERVGPLSERMRWAVAEVPGFTFLVDGIGAFPSAERPRVVWRGVGEGRAALEHLASVVRGAASAVGAPTDSAPFVAHVTLFRVRRPADELRARELLDGHGPRPSPTRVEARAVLLKESRLERSGATHTTLAEFPLGTAQPA